MNICDNLTYDFFTAGGLNSPAQITSLIDGGLNAEVAAQEAINGWELNHAEKRDLTHMRRNGYTQDDLVEAMQRFIDKRPDCF